MTIQAPIILLPSNGEDYSTNTRIQTLSGTVSPMASEVLVNSSSSGVSYTPGDSVWAWTGSLKKGLNTYTVTAVENDTDLESAASTINITFVQDSSFITIFSPTGVSLKRFQDKIQVITAENSELTLQGYNFYVSYQSSGVNNIYVKINSKLEVD